MNQMKSIEEAYIYTYPVVGMYTLLYEQVLDASKRKTSFYEFDHSAQLATPSTTFIPAPNNDTTYSRAWLDLRYGPVVIETPDTQGRFYSIQMLDMYSETFANLGKRLFGTKPRKFLITGPNWTGDVPKDMYAVSCNTNFALAFLRVLIESEDQLIEVKRIQKNVTIHPLNNTTKIVQNFPALCLETFCAYMNLAKEVLSIIVPDCQDPFLNKVKTLSTLDEEELQKGCEKALKNIEEGGLQFGENVHEWRIARKGIGRYESDYFQRAVVWHKGALANVAEESLYPSTFMDKQKHVLNGINHYVLRFEKGQYPPVSQFWSLTMYIYRNAFLAENEIDRYSIGDRTKDLHYDSDGSLTIYIQHDRPQEDRICNWLPAPAEPFYLTLRLYGPSNDAIIGVWNPPYVIQEETVHES